jgi:hypothetical protein
MTNTAALETIFGQLKISHVQRLNHTPVESQQQWKEAMVRV